MVRFPDTLNQTDLEEDDKLGASAGVPGLVVIFKGHGAAAIQLPLPPGGVLALGRDDAVLGPEADARMSRQHARVSYENRRFWVTDLKSRNGTTADGRPAPASVRQPVTRVIRMGDTLCLPVHDLRPMQSLGVKVQDGRVLGPALQSVLQSVERAPKLGTTLHIAGESGSGKEGIARAFHQARPTAGGRFIAVNCAAIPEGVAERLLFGAKRGAYSGADADTEGYVQAADGGTLFLDELPELSLTVQAKLLRVLESREVLPLGASRPRSVSLHICTASHKDLRAEVAGSRLREDLYFRLARPQVTVPPLRQRPEEIPWLLQEALQGVDKSLSLHASFVEACILRAWPGNVRELLAELRSTADTALAAASTRLTALHLNSCAGREFSAAPAEPAAERSPPPLSDRDYVEALLRRCQGNISQAARELDIHRTQLCRWIERHGIDVKQLAAER